MNLLLAATLVSRTHGPLQRDDPVECDPGTDVEDSQHDGLSRRYSLHGITRNQDDAVKLALERVDPVRHELAVDSRDTSITEVLSILQLAFGESGVAHVVRNSQLDNNIMA